MAHWRNCSDKLSRVSVDNAATPHTHTRTHTTHTRTHAHSGLYHTSLTPFLKHQLSSCHPLPLLPQRSPNLSPTGVPSHVHRELQLPMKRCCLRIFTKFSSHSRQHCVVAYLVEKYHDALRVSACGAQEQCMWRREH